MCCFELCVNAQNYTQKWNDFYKRTEFFDSYGNMIGYAKYNDLYNRMEYYGSRGNLQKTEQHNNLLKFPTTIAASIGVGNLSNY